MNVWGCPWPWLNPVGPDCFSFSFQGWASECGITTSAGPWGGTQGTKATTGEMNVSLGFLSLATPHSKQQVWPMTKFQIANFKLRVPNLNSHISDLKHPISNAKPSVPHVQIRSENSKPHTIRSFSKFPTATSKARVYKYKLLKAFSQSTSAVCHFEFQIVACLFQTSSFKLRILRATLHIWKLEFYIPSGNVFG